MKLGALANNVCRICGSETMGADIGCSCRKLYDKAIFMVLSKHSEECLEYNYSIKMRVVMNEFSKIYEENLKEKGAINKVFKTSFNRTFYPSVYEFYKKNGYVSSKQLHIVENKYFSCGLNEINDKIEKEKKIFLDNFKEKYDSEIIDVAWNLFKKRKAEKKAAEC
jgi:hypothetical protein